MRSPSLRLSIGHSDRIVRRHPHAETTRAERARLLFTCRREHVQRIARGQAGRQHVRTVRAFLPSATPTVVRLASTAQACGLGGGALALQQDRSARLGAAHGQRFEWSTVVLSLGANTYATLGCGAATQQRGPRASAPWRPAGCKRNSAATLRLVASRLGRWPRAQSWCQGGQQMDAVLQGAPLHPARLSSWLL